MYPARQISTLFLALAIPLSASASDPADIEGLFGPSRQAPPQAENRHSDTLTKDQLIKELNAGGTISEMMEDPSARVDSVINGLGSEMELADHVQLPTPQFNMVVNKKTGQVGFLSVNGRYYLEGTLIDVWQAKELRTIDDVKLSMNAIDIRSLDLADKALFSFGAGEQDTILFVDPSDKNSQTLMKEAKAAAQSNPQLAFHVIPVPLNQASMPAVINTWCAERTPEQLVSLLAEGGYQALPAAPEDCSAHKAIQVAFVTADMMGLSAIPTFLTPGGIVQQGLVEDFAGYVAEH